MPVCVLLPLSVVGNGYGADECLAERYHRFGGGNVERSHAVADNLKHATVVSGVNFGDDVVAPGNDMAFCDLGNLPQPVGEDLDIGSGHSAYSEVSDNVKSDSSRVNCTSGTGYNFICHQALHALVNGCAGYTVLACDFQIGRSCVLGKGV